MKIRKIKKKATRESTICSLPPDLLQEVLLHILSASPSPIKDIRKFRKICKDFHAICSSKRVGKYMAVEDWSMYWQDKPVYLAFLQSCADSENTDALFLLGLEEMFNRERFHIGLQYFQLSASKGHILSKYIVGLLLFREESSRFQGVELLKEISNDTDQCRKQASKIFWTMIWQKWPSLSFHRCEDLLCGALAVGGDNQWLHEDCVKRNFCSEVCKWAHKYKMFVRMN